MHTGVQCHKRPGRIPFIRSVLRAVGLCEFGQVGILFFFGTQHFLCSLQWGTRIRNPVNSQILIINLRQFTWAQAASPSGMGGTYLCPRWTECMNSCLILTVLALHLLSHPNGVLLPLAWYPESSVCPPIKHLLTAYCRHQKLCPL